MAIYMKRIAFILPVLIFISPLNCPGQSLQEKRRIEEQKRQDLKPTEAAMPVTKETIPSSIDRTDQNYLMEFMLKRVTFRYDLCKVIMLLLGVENEYITLDSQIAFLKENKLLPKKIAKDFKPMEPLRKGLAAYVFYKALDIKGGVIITVFGVSERYALKELSYQGIMPSGNTNAIVSGDELISTLTETANYLTKKQEQTKKAETEK